MNLHYHNIQNLLSPSLEDKSKKHPLTVVMSFKLILTQHEPTDHHLKLINSEMSFISSYYRQLLVNFLFFFFDDGNPINETKSHNNKGYAGIAVIAAEAVVAIIQTWAASICMVFAEQPLRTTQYALVGGPNIQSVLISNRIVSLPQSSVWCAGQFMQYSSL